MHVFLSDETAVINWKKQFGLHCSNPKIVDERINDHFRYLEEKGLIRIGEYDVLRKIFRKFNVQAVDFIDSQSEKINAPGFINKRG